MPEFIEVPVIRGFSEIKQLYYAIQPLGGVFCGGYVRYCCSPNPNPVKGSDVDIYCKDENIYENIKSFLKHSGLKIKFENNISITYIRPKKGPFMYAPPIQLIKPIREGAIVANGSMEEIISNFDFTVIRIGIIDPEKALADKDFLEDEKRLILRIKNIHCPISSTMRCMKYARKGYWMRPYNVLQLFADWENRDDNYRMKIAEYLRKTNEGKNKLTKHEIEHLEALMRID